MHISELHTAGSLSDLPIPLQQCVLKGDKATLHRRKDQIEGLLHTTNEMRRSVRMWTDHDQRSLSTLEKEAAEVERALKAIYRSVH